ncbi:MAG: glycosyltransferase family 2 protein, partial [Gaiellaceae bacterium]
TLNPRYGAVGMLAFPYYILFELLGPLIEVAGYTAVITSAALGTLSPVFFAAFFTVALLTGIFLSGSALALEELSFRRYQGETDGIRVVLAALAENLGYRQLVMVWRTLAFVDLARRRRGWGEMPRRGIGYAPTGGASKGR